MGVFPRGWEKSWEDTDFTVFQQNITPGPRRTSGERFPFAHETIGLSLEVVRITAVLAYSLIIFLFQTNAFPFLEEHRQARRNGGTSFDFPLI